MHAIHNIINSTGYIHVGSIVFRTSAEIFGAMTIYNSVIPWPRAPIGKHYKHTIINAPRCRTLAARALVVQHVYTFLFYPVSIDLDFRVQHSWVALASYCIYVRTYIMVCM